LKISSRFGDRKSKNKVFTEVRMHSSRIIPGKRMTGQEIRPGPAAALTRPSIYGIAITILPVIRKKETRWYP
jgi:hypothetical protein